MVNYSWSAGQTLQKTGLIYFLFTAVCLLGLLLPLPSDAKDDDKAQGETLLSQLHYYGHYPVNSLVDLVTDQQYSLNRPSQQLSAIKSATDEYGLLGMKWLVEQYATEDESQPYISIQAALCDLCKRAEHHIDIGAAVMHHLLDRTYGQTPEIFSKELQHQISYTPAHILTWTESITQIKNQFISWFGGQPTDDNFIKKPDYEEKSRRLRLLAASEDGVASDVDSDIKAPYFSSQYKYIMNYLGKGTHCKSRNTSFNDTSKTLKILTFMFLMNSAVSVAGAVGMDVPASTNMYARNSQTSDANSYSQHAMVQSQTDVQMRIGNNEMQTDMPDQSAMLNILPASAPLYSTFQSVQPKHVFVNSGGNCCAALSDSTQCCPTYESLRTTDSTGGVIDISTGVLRLNKITPAMSNGFYHPILQGRGAPYLTWKDEHNNGYILVNSADDWVIHRYNPDKHIINNNLEESLLKDNLNSVTIGGNIEVTPANGKPLTLNWPETSSFHGPVGKPIRIILSDASSIEIETAELGHSHNTAVARVVVNIGNVRMKAERTSFDVLSTFSGSFQVEPARKNPDLFQPWRILEQIKEDSLLDWKVIDIRNR